MTLGDLARCGECGRDLARRGGRGRPAQYCGPTCRRAAEYELRRVQGLIMRAEKAHQDARLKAALAGSWRVVAEEAQTVVTFWAGEVERLRGELRRLLAASEVADSYPESA